jgi:ketosteroid isomerase-like protein
MRLETPYNFVKNDIFTSNTLPAIKEGMNLLQIIAATGVLTSSGCVGVQRAHRQDALEIRGVLDDITDALNHQEWERLNAWLTHDAVWEVLPPVSWRFQGREAIVGFFTKNSTVVDLILISVAASAVDVQTADRATVRSTMNELLRIQATGAGMEVIGTYTDLFIKEQGQWKLAHRTFRPRFMNNVAAPNRISESTSVPSDLKNLPGAK